MKTFVLIPLSTYEMDMELRETGSDLEKKPGTSTRSVRTTLNAETAV